MSMDSIPKKAAPARSPKVIPKPTKPPSPAAAIRVAFFSDSLPERNGTGAYYFDLAHHLEAQVEALEVFQPLPRGKHSFLSLPMPGDPMQRLVTPNVFRLSEGYHKLNPHVVISVTPGPFGLFGLYLAKRHKAKFITAFHTDFEQLTRIYWNAFSRTMANLTLRTLNRILCKSSVAVLINNSNLEKDVRPLGAKAVEIMGTPLQPAFLDTPMKPLPPQMERICFAGRLAAEKNVNLIIEAARELPDVEFVIGGDGPLRSKLQASAQGLDNVKFLGWLSRTQLIELLDTSSLLLLPSKLETFGSIALEAMARGRPALVSANAGIHDWPMLKDGLFALQPGQSLADEIRTLRKIPKETWQEKALTCRSAAEQLNHETIGHWVELLSNYSKAE